MGTAGDPGAAAGDERPAPPGACRRASCSCGPRRLF